MKNRNRRQHSNLVSLAAVLIAGLATILPPAYGADPKPTPCTFTNKTRAAWRNRQEWDYEMAMMQKFVNGYIKEKTEYDTRNPPRSDVTSLPEDQMQDYYARRMEEVDQNYKQRLEQEDPEFYWEVQKGPKGWYANEEDAKAFRGAFWDYLTVVGWYKSAIMQYADDKKGSLQDAIRDAQGWANSGSRSALSTKKLTVDSLREVKNTLYKYSKELDALICPGAWFSSWAHSINNKAFHKYSIAMEAYRNNRKVVEQQQDAQARRQIQNNPTMQYLLNYFSAYRTVGPPGFNCTWGFRGDFSCGRYNRYGLLETYGSGPRR